MDFSTSIIIVIALGAAGSVLFWAGVAYLAVKAVQSYQQQMDAIMQNYSANLSYLQQTYGSSIPPLAQQQIFDQYLQARSRMRHFDQLSQAHQDLFCSDMLSRASAAGIDVSNW